MPEKILPFTLWSWGLKQNITMVYHRKLPAIFIQDNNGDDRPDATREKYDSNDDNKGWYFLQSRIIWNINLQLCDEYCLHFLVLLIKNIILLHSNYTFKRICISDEHDYNDNETFWVFVCAFDFCILVFSKNKLYNRTDYLYFTWSSSFWAYILGNISS